MIIFLDVISDANNITSKWNGNVTKGPSIIFFIKNVAANVYNANSTLSSLIFSNGSTVNLPA